MVDEPTFEELEAAFGGGSEPITPPQTEPSPQELQQTFAEEGMRQKAREGYLPQVGAFVTGVGQTIPFAKDIAAGANVLRSQLGGHPAGIPEEGTFGEKFTAAKQAQEQAQRVLGEEYPMTQMAGTAAGIGAQIMSPGTRALGAGERALAEMAGEAVPAVAAPLARGAVHTGVGAGVGAAYGAGEGTTLEERGENALMGAGVGAAGSLFAPVVGTLARPVGKKLGLIKPTPGVMSKDELFDAARDAYKASEQQGVMIQPSAIKQAHNDIVADLTDLGYHRKLSPELSVALDELNKLSMPTMQGQPNYTTLKGIDIINRMARKASSSPDQTTRTMGKVFHEKIDDLLGSLGPNNTIGGNAPEAVKALQEARNYWKLARKTEKVEDMIDTAILQTASTGSGGNINNKLKQAINKIINENKRKPSGWTPDELAAMRAIVEPGAAKDLARLFGKISPGGNGLHALLEMGAVAHNPKFAPVIAAGALSKAYADRATAAAVDDLLELIRVGGKRANMPKRNLTSGVKAKNIGIGATMAGINEMDRQERASGGRIGKRDYPAKKLSSLEKAARRALGGIAKDTTHIMDMPDEEVANALRMAK